MLKWCIPLSLERSPPLTSRTNSAPPLVAMPFAQPTASRTSHAWRPLQSPYCDPRRLDYVGAARPGRRHDASRDCSINQDGRVASRRVV
ncbi:hypothetical protein AYO39_01260 [Actinobacteria bacterium SCGC AG-212-D09]|nr:hypothetical protein AYO39_01260 [Actinobacteria bacterium SCGC AG-212-D09]